MKVASPLMLTAFLHLSATAGDRSQTYKVAAITDADEEGSVLRAVWNCRSPITYMTLIAKGQWPQCLGRGYPEA